MCMVEKLMWKIGSAASTFAYSCSTNRVPWSMCRAPEAGWPCACPCGRGRLSPPCSPNLGPALRRSAPGNMMQHVMHEQFGLCTCAATKALDKFFQLVPPVWRPQRCSRASPAQPRQDVWVGAWTQPPERRGSRRATCDGRLLGNGNWTIAVGKLFSSSASLPSAICSRHGCCCSARQPAPTTCSVCCFRPARPNAPASTISPLLRVSPLCSTGKKHPNFRPMPSPLRGLRSGDSGEPAAYWAS